MSEPLDPINDPNLPHITAFDDNDPDPTPPDSRVDEYEGVEVRAAAKPHFSDAEQ